MHTSLESKIALIHGVTYETPGDTVLRTIFLCSLGRLLTEKSNVEVLQILAFPAPSFNKIWKSGLLIGAHFSAEKGPTNLKLVM